MQILKILWRLFFAKKEASDVEIKGMEVKQMDVGSVSKVVAYIVFTALLYMAQLNVQSMADSLKGMQADVAELNEKMVVVVSKQVDHNDVIKDHEFRIRAIERK